MNIVAGKLLAKVSDKQAIASSEALERRQQLCGLRVAWQRESVTASAASAEPLAP